MRPPRRNRTNSRVLLHLLPGLLLLGCTRDNPHSTPSEPDGHVEEGHETHAGEDDHVELTEKQFAAAGINCIEAQPGRVAESLTLPGTVAPNADSVLHVTPRVSGQVRSVFKQLGEPVEAGELLCVIDSVELGDAVADYLRDREMVTAAEVTLEREQQLFDGRILALTRVLDGAITIQEGICERERELQQKAVSTLRPLLEAEKALALAKLDKDTQLTELEAKRDTRLLELQVKLRVHSIDLRAARNQLRTLGLKDEELDSMNDDSPLLSGEYRVFAPGTGVVVNRHVSMGEFVAAGSKLYIVEDLSDVWFVASAFEEQLQSVRTGQRVYVSLDAFPGSALDGVVSFLDYHVDPTSRSVGVRITLDNKQLDSWPEALPLRPGMFGRAELETTTREAAIVLPEAALVHDDAGDYVFVQVEPFAFERREVSTKHVAGGLVEVLDGLKVGEMVAITGNFFLKSAERQAELGGGHSH